MTAKSFISLSLKPDEGAILGVLSVLEGQLRPCALILEKDAAHEWVGVKRLLQSPERKEIKCLHVWSCSSFLIYDQEDLSFQ